MTTSVKKPDADWERIELDYRAGILSLREIAAKNPGASHVAISKRAKKLGWSRDLSAKIQAKAEELVNRATVNGAVNTVDPLTERETVDGTAHAILQIRIAQRTDITRAKNLALLLLGELESQTGDAKVFDKIGDLVSIDITGPDSADDGNAGEKRRAKLLDAYNKVLSLSGRIDNAKKLAETLKHLIGLEREAWGLEAPTQKLNVMMTGSAKEMSDDELAAVAAGSGARAPAPSQG